MTRGGNLVNYSSALNAAGALIFSVFVSACATSPVEPQQQALIRAEATIQEAEESGAYEHGSAELESARDKLAAARTAVEDGDEERAGRLATEATLDAELAVAIASNRQMQSAVDELNATIATLQEELERSQ
jgi:uncharacterized small protein (DUF1192 family)